MTGLQEKADKVADLLVEIARIDPRRGVVTETVLASTVLGAKRHQRDILTAEVLEALAHRVAALPSVMVNPVETQLKAGFLADLKLGAV